MLKHCLFTDRPEHKVVRYNMVDIKSYKTEYWYDNFNIDI